MCFDKSTYEYWCLACKKRHRPSAEHPVCLPSESEGMPHLAERLPDDPQIDCRGWRFRPPFICMGCGIEVCAHQWAFSRSCGACDVGDSRTRRLLYRKCFAGPHEQIGKETDDGFIPADHFIDPSERDKYPVIKRPKFRPKRERVSVGQRDPAST